MSQVQALHLMRKQLKVFTTVVLSVLLWGMSVFPAFAATPQQTKTTSATLAYNLLGLTHVGGVNQFHIGTTYIYITQKSLGTTHLSRLLINGNNATYVDEMTITNAGHGETLDMYNYNGVDYLYIGSKANTSTDYRWSLQVARVKYTPGVTYDYTDLHRFTYMNYANQNGTSLGTTYRVNAGGNSNYTLFRIQTEEGPVTWSIYDTVKLNQLLDNNVQVQMNSAGAKAAWIKGFTQSGSNIVRPNNSFQGVDMIGQSAIYTSGGVEGDTPSIAYMTNTGVYKTLVKISNVGTHEIEGMATRDNNVYFIIIADPSNKQTSQKIYYVPESIFK
ncbi:hypothetical protein PAESOLCIP111_01005 [Paenibacillus solanacearum]|uniref:P68 RBP/TagC-like beta-propeller domain-containing protein n=1 Tax=Paenibacillus solanacearum TaxID=2048548 RepID=A0A916JWQ2_9BACL|nr:helveticin J family class III bacteriocin [Paenibacillus solanacearum]CAG7607887.1 hypothetical protein PAESOLCIP111_01005 [Paenibacillus solanacearum]